MKKIFSIWALASLLACLPGATKAQFNITIVNTDEFLKAEAIDDVIFTAQYELNYLPDTTNADKRVEETMMLKVGRKSSVFYSYSKFLTDSIIEIDKKNDASLEVIQNHLKQYTAKVSYKIYKNYPTGKVTYTDQLGVSRFINQEDTPMPQWTILPDTMTILSYPCRKATCNFLGRTYQAWFTTQIPRSEGPWKLQGLPGLILKAHDDEQHYRFECTAIQQNNQEDNKIMYSDQGYEPISRKNLNKLYARFAADPVGYITNSAPNVKLVIRDQDGNATKNPKNTPHNPIERD
ncbi:GLPGLI family protein [Bacteroides sp. OttesenSCG-928-J23]|nr:GLPGLI family protein [Bacteroides sp. OttesenSCG-928-J23]MDL2303783.1 GLPGLI family protein [Bacteroides sp. OttesenSCG-928-D19]